MIFSRVGGGGDLIIKFIEDLFTVNKTRTRLIDSIREGAGAEVAERGRRRWTERKWEEWKEGRKQSDETKERS